MDTCEYYKTYSTHSDKQEWEEERDLQLADWCQGKFDKQAFTEIKFESMQGDPKVSSKDALLCFSPLPYLYSTSTPLLLPLLNYLASRTYSYT